MVDDRSCILDLAEWPHFGDWSSPHYPEYRERIMIDSQAIVLAYSITSRASFALIPQYLAQVNQVRSQPPLTPIPICLVGTKADEEGKREVSFAEGVAAAEGLGCAFAEVSAKEGTDVETVFCDIVRSIRRKRVDSAAKSMESAPMRRKSRLGSFYRMFRR